MSPKFTRTAAIITAVLGVIAVAFVGVMFWLIQRAPDKLPEITAYSSGESVQIEPMVYCTVWLQDCTADRQSTLIVPKGAVLQLSLPRTIADAPWKVVLEYLRPDGTLYQEVIESGLDHGALALTIATKDQLTLVELQLPSAVIDESGARAAHAFWSLQTV